ncbi:hypothetical protein F66182_7226 [Fusarium sp. NRRL 66182]|nr:hypothetical protein F66182_7226 [Fusarium sp. NRRL 66182]
MDRLFRRGPEPRRSSDDDYDNMQYYTPRGVIPAQVVEEQAHEVVIDPNGRDRRGFYPHVYGNIEGGKRHLFQPFEQRNKVDKTPLYEVPVGSRMDMSKKSASVKQVNYRENINRNERARVVQKELNDPGFLRGVVALNSDTGESCGVAGVMYHPEGNTCGFERAPLQPLDREGRQYLRRFADDSADPHRVTTWPPRDEDGGELAEYEDRYRQVRRPAQRPS